MDLEPSAVSKLILGCDEIRHALACGAMRITHGLVTLIADRGIVITVYPAGWRTDAEHVGHVNGLRARDHDHKPRKIQAANRARR